jgi:hypothetical protein
MIRLEVFGAHTHLLATACAACPHNAAGCCVSPPEHGWADVGRVVIGGGRAFLLEQLAAKNLLPGDRGLALRRARGRHSATEPRQNKCVYHGAEGCTIASSRRPSTCNYYLCEEAYREAGEPGAGAARAAQKGLSELYARWNREIAGRVAELWPEGPSWDEGFLDWLGVEMESRIGARGDVGHGHGHGHDPDSDPNVAVAVADPPAPRSEIPSPKTL